MTREPIYQALFDLVSGAPGLVTKSRKLLHWSDVPANQRPALFASQKREIALFQPGMPTKWQMQVDLYLYVSTKGTVVPGSVLNPLVDHIAGALDWKPIGVPQTLGGLVQWARIEGTIETDEGLLGDDAVAIIPVHILTV